jgi:hypothetical protein
MKIEEWIVNELESLEMNQSVSRPEYITFRADMICEILRNVDLELEDKDKLYDRARNLFTEHLFKWNLT